MPDNTDVCVGCLGFIGIEYMHSVSGITRVVGPMVISFNFIQQRMDTIPKYPHGLKSFSYFAHFSTKDFLAVSYFLVKTRNSGLKWVKLFSQEMDQKCKKTQNFLKYFKETYIDFFFGSKLSQEGYMSLTNWFLI